MTDLWLRRSELPIQSPQRGSPGEQELLGEHCPKRREPCFDGVGGVRTGLVGGMGFCLLVVQRGFVA